MDVHVKTLTGRVVVVEVDSKLTVKDLKILLTAEPTRQAEISYAVFCWKKKNHRNQPHTHQTSLLYTSPIRLDP